MYVHLLMIQSQHKVDFPSSMPLWLSSTLLHLSSHQTYVIAVSFYWIAALQNFQAQGPLSHSLLVKLLDKFTKGQDVTSSLSLGSAFVLDVITLVLVVLPEVSSSLLLLSSALETTLALVEVAVVEESSLTVFITLVRVLALMVWVHQRM